MTTTDETQKIVLPDRRGGPQAPPNPHAVASTSRVGRPITLQLPPLDVLDELAPDVAAAARASQQATAAANAAVAALDDALGGRGYLAACESDRQAGAQAFAAGHPVIGDAAELRDRSTLVALLARVPERHAAALYAVGYANAAARHVLDVARGDTAARDAVDAAVEGLVSELIRLLDEDAASYERIVQRMIADRWTVLAALERWLEAPSATFTPRPRYTVDARVAEALYAAAVRRGDARATVPYDPSFRPSGRYGPSGEVQRRYEALEALEALRATAADVTADAQRRRR